MKFIDIEPVVIDLTSQTQCQHKATMETVNGQETVVENGGINSNSSETNLCDSNNLIDSHCL